MLNWIIGRLRRQAERQAALKAIRSQMWMYHNLRQIERTKCARLIAEEWRGFLYAFPEGGQQFAKEPISMRRACLHYLKIKVERRVTAGAYHEATSAGLLSMYLSSIHNGDERLERLIVELIDPVLQYGWELDKDSIDITKSSMSLADEAPQLDKACSSPAASKTGLLP